MAPSSVCGRPHRPGRLKRLHIDPATRRRSVRCAATKGWTVKHMVSYTLKADQVAENERDIVAAYEALRQARPNGLRYATFRLGDGVSFVHIVSHEEADGANALTSLPAFKAFSAGVKERCASPPVRVDLTEIGSYEFFTP